MNLSEKKQRAVVICPGRGTYNKEELGYLHKLHSDKLDILDAIDADRISSNQTTVKELDSMDKYNLRVHSAGENAASLIYACSLADFQSINRDKYDIVAVTGNSMGWYIALAVANALNPQNAAHLINTMGSMMQGGTIGGQSIYPLVDENWNMIPDRLNGLHKLMDKINAEPEAQLHSSILLGGYLVFGGNEKGLKMMEAELPQIEDRYPMRLYNHAAFHTPLLDEIVPKAQSLLPSKLFQKPDIPLVDGEGTIWQPYSTDIEGLYQYTLGRQINRTYNFSKAIEVSIKEFAPDKLIILGPGATLGGAVAQTLIQHEWVGLTNKASFIDKQKTDPFVLAMGMENQRKEVIAN